MESTSSPPPVRCHCTLQAPWDPSPKRCPYKTAGPDSPFCNACEARHQDKGVEAFVERMELKIGTVPPGEHPGEDWLSYNTYPPVKEIDKKFFGS